MMSGREPGCYPPRERARGVERERERELTENYFFFFPVRADAPDAPLLLDFSDVLDANLILSGRGR
jgi:hypothetical protein